MVSTETEPTVNRPLLSALVSVVGACDRDLDFDERLCLIRRVGARLRRPVPEEVLLDLVARHLRGDGPEGARLGRPVAQLPDEVCEFLVSIRNREPAHSPDWFVAAAEVAFPPLRWSLKAVRRVGEASTGRGLAERLAGPGLRWVPGSLGELEVWSGLTTARIARASGVPVDDLESWLCGDAIPPANVLPALADTLDLPVSALFDLRRAGQRGVA